MKIEAVDNIDSRILVNLIINSQFVKEYIRLFKGQGVFTDNLGAALIENWAVGFYESYGAPIGKEIGTHYETAIRNKTLDADGAKLIEAVLNDLSKHADEYKSDNVAYWIDIVRERVNRLKLDKLKASLTGNTEKALQVISEFKAIGSGDAVPVTDFMSDETAVTDIYKPDALPLVPVPKTMDIFHRELSKQTYEGAFVLFRGRAKSKKTWMLIEAIKYFILAKKTVVLFELGDLTKAQTMRRLWTAFTNKPAFSSEEFYKEPVIDCMYNVNNSCMSINRTCRCALQKSDGQYNKDYKACSSCRGKKPFPVTVTHVTHRMDSTLPEGEAKKCQEALKLHMGEAKFLIYNFSAGTTSAKDIYQKVKELNESGVHPDVVALDHFDQMKPPAGNTRDDLKVEQSAMVLRNIALDFKSCVLCADQASRGDEETYVGRGIAKDMYATSVITINSTAEDRRAGVVRVFVPLAREGSISEGNQMMLVGALEKGELCKDSYLITDEDQDLIDKLNPNNQKGEKKWKRG